MFTRLAVISLIAVLPAPGQGTVPITVATKYNGLTMVVDGQTYNQAQTFQWTPGSTHTLSVSSPEYSCGGKYTFTNWSIGGGLTQTITTPSSPRTYTANFNAAFHLVLDWTQGGSVTRSASAPEDHYPEGSVVTLTAVPASGYTFAGWSSGMTGSANPVQVIMQSLQTLTAVFVPVGTPSVTIGTNPAGLPVVVDGQDVGTPATYNWPPNSGHQVDVASPIMANDSLRYVFNSWSDNGVKSHTITSQPLPTVYTANLTPQTPLRLTSSPAEGGSISTDLPGFDGWAPQSFVVRLTATPAPGYRFDRWTGDLATPANPTLVTMEGARTATAIFVPTSGCGASFIRGAVSVAAIGDIVRAGVSASGACAWSVTSDASWISFPSASSGTGPGSVRFAVQANATNAPRAANLRIAPGSTLRVIQPAAGCAFTLASQSFTAGAAGGVNVSTPQGDPGCRWAAANPEWILVNPNEGLAGAALTYTVAPNAGAMRTGSVSIAGQLIHVLQKPAVAPTPAFTDVPPNDLFFDHIQLLSSSLPSAGCTAATYCPNANTTRAQMAEWIIRPLFGDSFSYNSTPFFTDVLPAHPHFRFIQKLKETGITSGCEATKFCPQDNVTRGQMAAFLVRARLGLTAADSFPFPVTPHFADVAATHPFFGYIQKLKELGVTGGCTATGYCADAPATRGQMAVFVVRAFFTP